MEEDTENPVRDKDFEVFYNTHASKEETLSPQSTTILVSEDQEHTEAPEDMVIERRLPGLLSLLESHARTTMPEVPVILRPPTPIIPAPIQIEPIDKKRKRDRRVGKGVVDEGEVQEETPLEPTKVVKMTRTQQRKGVERSNTASERRSKALIWNPSFALDDSPLLEDASIRDFNGGRVGYIANTVEQALLLPRDMDELQNLKKHELFLFMKRDLALVTLLLCITI